MHDSECAVVTVRNEAPPTAANRAQVVNVGCPGWCWCFDCGKRGVGIDPPSILSLGFRPKSVCPPTLPNVKHTKKFRTPHFYFIIVVFGQAFPVTAWWTALLPKTKSMLGNMSICGAVTKTRDSAHLHTMHMILLLVCPFGFREPQMSITCVVG